MEPTVIGIIYPLPGNLVKEILHKNKSIFYKYLGRVPTKKTKERLTEGMYLFIYESGGSKKIVGIAEIEKITYETADEIISRYPNTMMGTKSHLKKYSKNREEKKLQVLKLNNVEILKNPIIFNQHMSVSGRYMFADCYNSLKK